MNFIRTKNIDVIEELKKQKYQLITITSNGEHIFVNDPPLEYKFSDKEEVLFTDNMNF